MRMCPSLEHRRGYNTHDEPRSRCTARAAAVAAARADAVLLFSRRQVLPVRVVVIVVVLPMCRGRRVIGPAQHIVIVFVQDRRREWVQAHA